MCNDRYIPNAWPWVKEVSLKKVHTMIKFVLHFGKGKTTVMENR